MLLTGRSSELGLILQTSHVARGSVDCSCFRYCSLIHCLLFGFQGSATVPQQASLQPGAKSLGAIDQLQ